MWIVCLIGGNEMFDEIGSEYWMADLGEKINHPVKGAVYAASGRSAQSIIIESIKTDNRTALLPAYTCQHIVEPFDWKGWKVDFYDINRDLTPNIESFKSKIGKNPGCIIIQGYYSFPTAQNIINLIQKAQHAGAIIIEDITHSFLNDEQCIYKNSDYIFCSLRKWSGLSDGGYAVSLCGKELVVPMEPMKPFVEERHLAREIKKEYVRTLNPETKEKYLYHYGHSEEILDNDIGIYRMSMQAYEDYIHLDLPFIKEKRRDNFKFLLDNIYSKYVQPIFKELPKGIYPIMFPVYIEQERDNLRKKLISERIYCPVHWPSPIQLGTEARENSFGIYSNIMSIPCDQRYSKKDMERLVDVINKY